MADDATLDGFLITNAAGEGPGGEGSVAANVDCGNGTSPTIANNNIIGNLAPAVFLFSSFAMLVDNTISGNPDSVGGPPFPCPCDAILSRQSLPTIVNNVIEAADPNGNISAIDLSNTSSDITGGITIQTNHITGEIRFGEITALFLLVDNAGSHNIIVSGNIIISGNTIISGGDVLFLIADVGVITIGTAVNLVADVGVITIGTVGGTAVNLVQRFVSSC